MRCINHQQVDAVAVCMSCGAALCPECNKADSDGVHVCSERCASRLTESANSIRELVSKNRFGYKLLPILFIGMGGFFLLLAVSSLVVGAFRRVDLMTLVIGILFIAFGIYSKRLLKQGA